MNRHALRHRILSATCLPFHHSGITLFSSRTTIHKKIGGGNRNRTGGKGVADPCLTAWLCRRRKWSGRRDSNPRPRPWQGRILPLNYFRETGVAGFEPTSDGVKVRCLTAWLYPKKINGATEGNRTLECRNHNPMC